MEENIREESGFKYLEQGEGPVIIVLHGLFGALSNFKDVVDHFSKKYTVVIPMMPIYELPVINTNVKNLTKFIREFIEFKGYEKVNLLGNSLGGHVGLVYTSKYLSSVNSLTLTGSSGLYENAMGGSFPRREDYDYITEKVGLTFFDPKHATKELVDECFDIVNDRTKVVRTLALAKSAIRHNMAKELPSLNVPTCLIWGKNDTITPPEVAEEFNELLPCADLYWIDECGHAPMMEQPQEFNKLYSTWLDRLFN
ncbi:alpha/beta hydrolase [Flavobacteriales bacterium]|nr:alpha/beta hydrolase [Flavobacteriales bacterium]